MKSNKFKTLLHLFLQYLSAMTTLLLTWSNRLICLRLLSRTIFCLYLWNYSSFYLLNHSRASSVPRCALGVRSLKAAMAESSRLFEAQLTLVEKCFWWRLFSRHMKLPFLLWDVWNIWDLKKLTKTCFYLGLNFFLANSALFHVFYIFLA